MNLYDYTLNDGNLTTPSKTNEFPCKDTPDVMSEEQETENDNGVPPNDGIIESEDVLKFTKGLFAYTMTIPGTSIEQEEDFCVALLYKLVDVGISFYTTTLERF